MGSYKDAMAEGLLALQQMIPNLGAAPSLGSPKHMGVP
jgi:hypothetical protein